MCELYANLENNYEVPRFPGIVDVDVRAVQTEPIVRR